MKIQKKIRIEESEKGERKASEITFSILAFYILRTDCKSDQSFFKQIFDANFD